MIFLQVTIQQYSLWYKTPASDWESQALPVGNGHMGAMLFGGIDKEIIQYNEKTFWSGGPNCGDHNFTYGNTFDAYNNVKLIQDMQLNGQTPDNQLFDKVLGNKICFGFYQNFGNFEISTNNINSSQAINYKRELFLENASHVSQYEVNQQKYVRTTFASYPDNVIVHRLQTTQINSSYVIKLAGTHANSSTEQMKAIQENKTIILQGKLNKGQNVSDTLGNVGNNQYFESQLHIRCDSEDSAQITVSENYFNVVNCRDVVLILTAGTDYINDFTKNFTGQNPHDQIQSRIQRATQLEYKQLWTNSFNDYTKLYNRSSIIIGTNESLKPTDELLKEYKQNKGNQVYLELLFYSYGKYLQISSSRNGSLPANLQGVWNNQNQPAWQSDYHFNVNIEMNYWMNQPNGLFECDDALLEYIDKIRIPGRLTAKHYFNFSGDYGWVVNTANSPFGNTAPGISWDFGWGPANNAWIVQTVWDHYQFTLDTVKLKQIIYPILKETAYFWNEALVQYKTNDSKTYFVGAPGYSAEHGPKSFGVTYDTQLIRQMFKDFLQAAQIINESSDIQLINEVQHKLDNLYPTKIGKHGQIQEWLDDIDDPNDHHRHCSHLVGLYPGKEINNQQTPELVEAAKISLNHRGDVESGWSRANKMCLWARLHDGERVRKIYQGLLKDRILANLFDSHPPFQIDGNFGAVAGFAELFIQSHLNFTTVIPSLPDIYANGSFKGLRARGNYSVNCDWTNKKLTKLEINSGSSNIFIFDYQGAKQLKIKDLANNKNVEFSCITDNRIKLDTEKDHRYQFIW